MATATQSAQADAPATASLPLVLLHGVGLDRTMWEPLCDELKKTGQREIIALDLPGHGQEPPLRERQNLASLAEMVRVQLPDECDVLGFSLGALIAQSITATDPKRIHKLMCVSSVCRRTDEEAAAVFERLNNAAADATGSAEASIERWFPSRATTVPSEVVEDIRSILLNNDPESFLHSYRVFATGDAEISDELGLISVQTLAITGDLDPGSTPEMTHRLARAIPNSRELVVPGARHMLPVEKPRELAAAIVAFLG